MYTISSPIYEIAYPTEKAALIVPSGYPDSPNSFDSSAVDIFQYLKGNNFDIDILSTPGTFSIVELNSNLIRLGKFAVKDIVIPVFVGLMINYLSSRCDTTQVVDDEPVKLSMSIEVCDSTNMKVYRQINFEGSADDFNEMASNIEDIINAAQ